MHLLQTISLLVLTSKAPSRLITKIIVCPKDAFPTIKMDVAVIGAGKSSNPPAATLLGSPRG